MSVAGRSDSQKYTYYFGNIEFASGTVSLGDGHTQANQGGNNSIRIGNSAAIIGQGANSVAMGFNAGKTNQSTNSIAIGYSAGSSAQGSLSVAIGYQAGDTGQGAGSIAIGDQAGSNLQGANSIAIGSAAGRTNQAANTVVISALGAIVTGATASATYIAPLRSSAAGKGANVLYYDPVTHEVLYSTN